jgi:hypothetical protein
MKGMNVLGNLSICKLFSVMLCPEFTQRMKEATDLAIGGPKFL